MNSQSGPSDQPDNSGRQDRSEFNPGNEGSIARRIWEMSVEASPESPRISQDEVEQALDQTHKRLGWDESEFRTSGRKRSFSWRWAAAAALLIIILGAGWLIYPRTVSAPYGEMITHTLPDGSSVELNSGTTLQYNKLYSLTHRDVFLEGEAFFQVQHSDQQFTVSTNSTITEVTGTRFNVRSWHNGAEPNTELTVTEGSVRFYPEAIPDSSVVVTAGMASSWSPDRNAPAMPRPVSVDRVTAWRTNQLVFDNRSLGVIFNELERRFDVRIRLEGPDLSNELLTAYYDQPEEVETVIQDICRVKGLNYSRSARGFRIYR